MACSIFFAVSGKTYESFSRLRMPSMTWVRVAASIVRSCCSGCWAKSMVFSCMAAAMMIAQKVRATLTMVDLGIGNSPWLLVGRGSELRALEQRCACSAKYFARRSLDVFTREKFQLVSKLLAAHQPAEAAVHDADADTAELRAQDVCAMAGRVHQARVRKRERRREREIFTCGKETDVRRLHAIEGRESFRRVVREVTAREHVGRVLPRDLRQLRIGRQRTKSRCNSFLIHKLEHSLLQVRSRPDVRHLERQRDAFIRVRTNRQQVEGAVDRLPKYRPQRTLESLSENSQTIRQRT